MGAGGMNPLRGSCVSERSRCGAVRISKSPLRRLYASERSRRGAVRMSKLAEERSAEIVRVGALSLWRRANFFTWPANPLRRLCVSERSRCGAVRISKLADEPSAEIVFIAHLLHLSLLCHAACRPIDVKELSVAELGRIAAARA